MKIGDRQSRANSKSWFMAQVTSAQVAEILVYDEIGAFGVGAKPFIKALDSLEGITELHIRLNTPGGDAYDGIAIYNALRRLSDDEGVKVVTWVDALAASAGSLVAIAGDEIKIAENAFIMIHEPWTIAAGNAEGFRTAANRLEQLTEAVLKTYVGRTDLELPALRQMLKDETWIGGEEAVELGFADEVVQQAQVAEEQAALLFRQHDLSSYKQAPTSLTVGRDYDIIKSKKRGFEEALREAGATRSEAKAIVATGLRALQQEAEGAEEAKRRLEEEQQLVKMIAEMKAILN